MRHAELEALVGHKLVRVGCTIPPVDVVHKVGTLEWGWCGPRLMAVRHVPGMVVVGREDPHTTTDGTRWVPVHLEPDAAVVLVPDTDGSWYVVVVDPDQVQVLRHPGPWDPKPIPPFTRL